MHPLFTALCALHYEGCLFEVLLLLDICTKAFVSFSFKVPCETLRSTPGGYKVPDSSFKAIKCHHSAPCTALVAGIAEGGRSHGNEVGIVSCLMFVPVVWPHLLCCGGWGVRP